MTFGILKDIKEGEYRVILTPLEVSSIAAAGHKVYAEKDCGKMAGFSNEAYAAAGAEILETHKEVFEKCDFVAKVKEIAP